MRVLSVACRSVLVATVTTCLHAEDLQSKTSPAAAPIGLGFEVGLNWYTPDRKPLVEGRGQFIAFDTVTDDLRLGLRFESVNYRSKSDADMNASSTEVEYDVQFHEVRVQRAIVEDVIVIGISAGMARVRARPVLTSNNDITINRLAPTGDIFAAIAPITGGHYASAAFNIVMGYRFLRIPGSDPDGNGDDYTELLHDMSGFHVGMSISAVF